MHNVPDEFTDAKSHFNFFSKSIAECHADPDSDSLSNSKYNVEPNFDSKYNKFINTFPVLNTIPEPNSVDYDISYTVAVSVSYSDNKYNSDFDT